MNPHDRKNGLSIVVRKDNHEKHSFKINSNCGYCGGVDESAKVWINGKEVGISHGAAMYPFELAATDQLKPGNNVVVVCVANNRVNEIGTGGILAPVMLYAPKKGKEAKLENVRDLKPTFP